MRPVWTYQSPALSADYRKALEVLHQQSCHWEGKQLSDRLTPACWVQGSVTSVPKKVAIKDIPSDLSWHWSQSRARFLLTNEDGSSISVAKLCSRPRKPSRSSGPPLETLATFKIWSFELVQPGIPDITVLWCENGWKEGSSPTVNGPFTGVSYSPCKDVISTTEGAFLSPDLQLDDLFSSFDWGEPSTIISPLDTFLDENCFLDSQNYECALAALAFPEF